MLQLKPLSEIAGADAGWLKARHHFAIGPYGNPQHRAIGNLYVLNDDEIAAYSGFPFHPHADVEIVSYLRQGTLTHEDGLGNKGHLKAGDIQVMSAGTGIRHAEYNDDDTPLHVFQIWLHPRTRGAEPRWETRAFPKDDRVGRFVTLASGYDVPGALPIRSDAELHGAVLPARDGTTFDFRDGHSGYLVPVSGALFVDGQRVEAGEGVTIRGERSVRIEAVSDAEIILVATKE